MRAMIPLVAALVLVTGQPATAEATAAEALDRYMANAAAEGFVGAVLVAREDEILHAGGYGTLSATEGRPVDLDSVAGEDD